MTQIETNRKFDEVMFGCVLGYLDLTVWWDINPEPEMFTCLFVSETPAITIELSDLKLDQIIEIIGPDGYDDILEDARDAVLEEYERQLDRGCDDGPDWKDK